MAQGPGKQYPTNPAQPPPPKPKPRTKSFDLPQHILGPGNQDKTDRAPAPAPKPKPKPGPKPDCLFQRIVLDPDYLKQWWASVSPWDSLQEDFNGKKENEIIAVKARRFHIAVQLFDLLMTEKTKTLSNYMSQLNLIADHLDMVSNRTKVAGISGGTTAVLGGLAAGAGILLAPLTLGASLAITVVGAGVATAGGVAGASAAIAHKVDLENEKKKIRKVFQDNKDNIQDLQRCLEFIVEGMNQLAQHPSASLSKVKVDPVKLNMVYHLGGGVCPRAIEANVKASGIMEGLAIGLDMFFKDGKGATKNKLRSKCAAKLRVLVQEMGTGLREFERAKESLKVFLP
ncbi:unnamed protein product [Gadus morhua 'NCC']